MTATRDLAKQTISLIIESEFYGVAEARRDALRAAERILRMLDAIADTHPKDGDVKQAPLVSGGGSGTEIAQQPPSSPLNTNEGE